MSRVALVPICRVYLIKSIPYSSNKSYESGKLAKTVFYTLSKKSKKFGE